MTEMSDPTIRLATPDDAPALLAIYEPYVRQTAITCEYEVPSVEEFAGRIERTLKRYPYLVMELDGRPGRLCLCESAQQPRGIRLVGRDIDLPGA